MLAKSPQKTDVFYKRIVPLIISFALFMESVDTTIINTAIPAMATSLTVNPIDLKIALISYLLSLAIFIPISGWIADKFGIKRIFILALSIFILASFFCGASRNLLELVIARTLQGIGGSLMIPIGRLIILRTFKRHELMTIMSRVITVAALGMMLGPVLGGYITHYFSWRWIFWVNIPIGLIVILMAKQWLVETPPQPVLPLDKFGFILFGLGLAGFTFSLSAFSESTLNTTVALCIMLSSIGLLLFYFWHSRHQTNPIVNTKLLGYRTFRVSVLGNLISRISFGGVPFLLPLLLQIGLNYPAQTAGLLLAPTALGVIIIKPFSPILLRIFGFKRFLILNTFLVGLIIWTFTIINSHTSVYIIGFLTFIFGFLMTLQYTGMNSLAYAEIPAENLSSGISIMSTIQQLSQSFGVAISALLINYFSMKFHNNQLTPNVFHHTFLAMGIITLFSILIFLRLKSSDGQQMIQQPV